MSTPFNITYSIQSSISAAFAYGKPVLLEGKLVTLDEFCAKVGLIYEWISGRPAVEVDCLVLHESKVVIFAFRGTSDLAGWMKDAEIAFQKYKLPNGKVIGIHSGFYSTVDAVFLRLAEIAVKAIAEGKKVYVDGHSKAAGEGVIFAGRLFWERGIKVEPMYVPGCPRTFNRAGQIAFEKIGLTLWRVLDEADVVCRIPLASLSWSWGVRFLQFYFAVGQTAFFNKWGNLAENEPAFAHIPSDIACIISEAMRHKIALTNDHGIGLYIQRQIAYKEMMGLP